MLRPWKPQQKDLDGWVVEHNPYPGWCDSAYPRYRFYAHGRCIGDYKLFISPRFSCWFNYPNNIRHGSPAVSIAFKYQPEAPINKQYCHVPMFVNSAEEAKAAIERAYLSMAMP